MEYSAPSARIHGQRVRAESLDVEIAGNLELLAVKRDNQWVSGAGLNLEGGLVKRDVVRFSCTTGQDVVGHACICVGRLDRLAKSDDTIGRYDIGQ